MTPVARWREWSPLTIIGVVFILVGLMFLIGATVRAQAFKPEEVKAAQQTRPVPKVEFGNLPGGWIMVDQVGDGSRSYIRRQALIGIAFFDKKSKYARTVYRDDYDLVVLSAAGSEWRIRFATKEKAGEFVTFILDEED